MKKLIYSIATLLPLFAACNKAENLASTEEQGVYITLPVGFQESKTAYDPSLDIKCKWVAGDKVATKVVASGSTYENTYWYGDTKGVILGSDGTATITAYAGYSNRSLSKVYAVYPWDGTSSSSASNWERADNMIIMPDTQQPGAASFDPLADIMSSLEAEITPTASNQETKLIFCHRVGFMALKFKSLPETIADENVESVTIKASAPLAAKLQVSEPAQGSQELSFTNVAGTEKNEITLSYSTDIKLSDLVAYACVLPGTYQSLSFVVKTKSGSTVNFAERNVNVSIAEGQMIHPSVSFDESKGDAVEGKDDPQPSSSYTLTITPSGSYLGAETTDTSVTDAVKEFGLAGTCAFTTKYNYASNSKPIGKQILSFEVVADNTFNYSLGSSELSSASTKYTGKTLSLSDTDIPEGSCYFYLSTFYTGSGSKVTVTKCNISKIVITYTK